MSLDMNSPTSASRLTAQDLSLAYGKKTIIEHLNISIRDGEFSVIIGPNGCGKSTYYAPLAEV